MVMACVGAALNRLLDFKRQRLASILQGVARGELYLSAYLLAAIDHGYSKGRDWVVRPAAQMKANLLSCLDGRCQAGQQGRRRTCQRSPSRLVLIAQPFQVF